MIQRKAQAALEFLSTYGFAFLIILVMIGALAYFGVLNPQRFLPERCMMGQEFNCADHYIGVSAGSGNMLVNVSLTNNLGTTITSLSGTANMTGVGGGTCTSPSTTVASGATFHMNCALTLDTGVTAWPAVGQKAKVELQINYKEQGKSYLHPVQGEVFATIQSAP